jgi:KipI family sensor histidine kinase inhibitor
MTDHLRFLPAGEDAVLIELADLPTTLALFAGLRAALPAGVTGLVPAARTLMVRFDPDVTDLTRLADIIAGVELVAHDGGSSAMHEIPVVYDGEDLEAVAKHLRCSIAELIRRHTAAVYTVAFAGFAPGFDYLTCDDPLFDVPRRQSPRTRVPAGAVALGGKFAGIYPTDSPGGWQILGRTRVKMWDPARARPALFAPGDRVRFRAVNKDTETLPPRAGRDVSPTPTPSKGLLVTRAERPALFQDLGREGYADQGVGESGALDRAALIDANICVGNSEGAAALEICLGGFALKTDRPVTIAVTGAPAPLAVSTADGRTYWAPLGRPFALRAGDELKLEPPSAGTRSYLSLRGGFRTESVLGSASTDLLGKIGPAPVVQGSILVPADDAAGPVNASGSIPKRLPKASETVTLDIVPGPRADWFSAQSIERLFSQPWKVSAESSRVGARLVGAEPLARAITGELPSEGTVLGAIQVPPSGQPIIFLADHPLTGGYPVIGVIARHHRDLAGQTPIGAMIRFNALGTFAPVIKRRANR